YSEDGRGHHVRIGDAVDMGVEDFVALEGHDPVQLTNVFHPSNTTLTVAPANAAHLSTPFTVDGLILAASMLILDASRRHHPVPPLARWCLGAGITATIGANLAHGLGSRPDRGTGERLGRPGPGWLLRTSHDPHPNRTTRADHSHPHMPYEPGALCPCQEGSGRAWVFRRVVEGEDGLQFLPARRGEVCEERRCVLERDNRRHQVLPDRRAIRAQ